MHGRFTGGQMVGYNNVYRQMYVRGDTVAKWDELWGYFVKALIAVVLLLMFSSALGILGLIVLILLLIAFLIVSLMRFLYVYEMAKLFQGVAEHKE